jgi:hypothetical protein
MVETWREAGERRIVQGDAIVLQQVSFVAKGL